MSTSVDSRANREINEQSFTDLFPNAVEKIEPMWVNPDGSWGDDLLVTFAGELTSNQIYLARRRMRTTPEMENLEKQGVTAYGNITTFLAIASPTNAQVVAQVKLQAQVIQGLLKLTFPDAARELLGGL